LNSADGLLVASILGAAAFCESETAPSEVCGDAAGGFPTVLGGFVAGCSVCNLADPNVDFKACVHKYCDEDHVCADAAQSVLQCAGRVSDQYKPLVDLILSWDGFCHSNTTEECSDAGVGLKFAGLMAKCECPDLVTCSGQTCSWEGECLAAAQEITLCNGYVSAELQDFFDAPRTDCNPPVCNAEYKWDPAPKGGSAKAGDECCQGNKGKHGTDGTCCLAAGTSFKDKDNAECCYTADDGIKKGACGGKDFSSATGAFSGLMLVAVTILFQL
jgi:hypothetical protein